MWLARHTPENTMPTIEKALGAVREEYGDKEYRSSYGISVVGYCFGGKYALRLAARDDVTAAAVAHGRLAYNRFLGGPLANSFQEPWSQRETLLV